MKPSNLPVTMIYQPRGSLFCHSDYDCNGFKDSFLWLCRDYTLTSELICTGYGSYERGARIYPISSYKSNDGLILEYSGQYKSNIKYLCNPNASTPFSLERRLDAGVFEYTVFTSESCPKDSSGSAPLKIHWSTKGKTPTPTLLLHPQPHHFMYDNYGNYVFIDQDNAQNLVSASEVQVSSQGKVADATLYYAPFYTNSCPENCACKEFKDAGASS